MAVTSQIWTNRLTREFTGLADKLPKGVTLEDHQMDAGRGVCKALFDFSISIPPPPSPPPPPPPPSSSSSQEDGGGTAGAAAAGGGGGAVAADYDAGGGKDATSAAKGAGGGKDPGENTIDGSEDDRKPSSGGGGGGDGSGAGTTTTTTVTATPVVVNFKLEFDFDIDTTKYPFDPPVVRAIEGIDALPLHLVVSDRAKSGRIVIPGGGKDSWTPSNTILGSINSIYEAVTAAYGEGGGGGGGGDGGAGGGGGVRAKGDFQPGQTVHIDKVNGTLFPCRVQSPFTLINRYLAVTPTKLLELEAHRTQINQVTIVAAYPLQSLGKLKFKRGESMLIVLKDGTQYEFFMTQAHQCIEAISTQLRESGISGHTIAQQAEQQVDEAKRLLTMIDAKERELTQSPSLQCVQECMDLFRQATELFGAVSDDRHHQVIERMHAFLQREDVLSILEGEPMPPKPRSVPAPPARSSSSSSSSSSGGGGGSSGLRESETFDDVVEGVEEEGDDDDDDDDDDGGGDGDDGGDGAGKQEEVGGAGVAIDTEKRKEDEEAVVKGGGGGDGGGDDGGDTTGGGGAGGGGGTDAVGAQ